ncbi:MAG: hypothetical protein ACODAG_05535 [Myxococcota bacterium]
MSTFQDIGQLYGALDTLLRRVSDQPAIVDALLAAGFGRRELAHLWRGSLERIRRVARGRQTATAVEDGVLPVPLVDRLDEAPPPPRFRASSGPQDEAALRVEMLRRMHLVRAFEEKLAELSSRGAPLASMWP